MLSFVLSRTPTGPILADWSAIARDIMIETTTRGYGTCTATIPLPRKIARQWYGQLDNAHLVIRERGQTRYEGRIEIPETTPEGLALTAYGYSRAYSDLPVTDLWSTGSVQEWRAMEPTDFSTRDASRWTIDTDKRLYIAPNGGEAHDISHIGALTYAASALSTNRIQNAAFTYSFTAPTGWICLLSRWTDGFTFQTTVWTLNGNGAAQTGTQNLAITACDRLVFDVYFNRAATTLGTTFVDFTTTIAAAITAGVRTVTPASMTGISAGMWVTVDDDTVDTSIAAGVGATGVQIVTPVSMAGIIVGSVLDIDDFSPETVTVTATTATTFTATYALTHGAGCTVRRNSPASEDVYVTAVTGATFTATFASNHVAGSRARRAMLRRVRPVSMTGIVRGARVSVGTMNTAEVVEVLEVTAASFVAEFTQPHASTDPVTVVWDGNTGDIALLITNLQVKATTSATITADEVARMFVSRVVATNPNQASSTTARIKSPGFDLKEFAYTKTEMGNVLDHLAALGGDGWLWSWRVWDQQILIFDRVANGGQTYQVYATPDISRDLGSLRTAIRPVYTNALDQEVLGTSQINTQAEARAGIRRVAYFDAPTSSATDANTLAAAFLLDQSIVNAFGDITVSALWQNGQRVPLGVLRSGDTIQCVEFPATGNSETDKTRQFRVGTTSYDVTNRTLTISPEQRAPKIDSLLARRDVSMVGD